MGNVKKCLLTMHGKSYKTMSHFHLQIFPMALLCCINGKNTHTYKEYVHAWSKTARLVVGIGHF
jgi:hypothetical protein